MIWFITRFEGRSYKQFKTMHWFIMGFMIAGLLIASIFIIMVGAPSKDRKLLDRSK